ncbi:hypothetical protein [Planctomycetes bacterium SV_7m_r]|uniref:hypothetical protein n=1 Tax=Stieleria bergensis TaxID=2528025 RepID=UPI0011A1C3BD
MAVDTCPDDAAQITRVSLWRKGSLARMMRHHETFFCFWRSPAPPAAFAAGQTRKIHSFAGFLEEQINENRSAFARLSRLKHPVRGVNRANHELTVLPSSCDA